MSTTIRNDEGNGDEAEMPNGAENQTVVKSDVSQDSGATSTRLADDQKEGDLAPGIIDHDTVKDFNQSKQKSGLYSKSYYSDYSDY